MLSWIFRDLRLGGVLTSPQATPSGLQMIPPSLPGTENPRKHGSPDFILIMKATEPEKKFVCGLESILPYMIHPRSTYWHSMISINEGLIGMIDRCE